MQSTLINTAAEIVALGVQDPDLFVALALFEPGIGPDRICDMTANVILPDLLVFNHRILKHLKIPTQEFEFTPDHRAQLPQNPYEKRHTPILLIPNDVLRHLPISKDWSSAMDAASHNSTLRHRVNVQIGNIWGARTRRDKAFLRQRGLSSKDAFETVLAAMQAVPKEPYDQAADPAGEIFWRALAAKIKRDFPFSIDAKKLETKDDAANVVDKIIARFKFLIEKKRLSSELYVSPRKPRPERAVQKLFFAVADACCDANNLDITPEAETGVGPVDFKFSLARSHKIVVEVKLSTNPKVLDGYRKQLRQYQESEEATKAYYQLIDVGRMRKKDQQLLNERNALIAAGEGPPEIIIINGSLRPSASRAA